MNTFKALYTLWTISHNPTAKLIISKGVEKALVRKIQEVTELIKSIKKKEE